MRRRQVTVSEQHYGKSETERLLDSSETGYVWFGDGEGEAGGGSTEDAKIFSGSDQTKSIEKDGSGRVFWKGKW